MCYRLLALPFQLRKVVHNLFVLKFHLVTSLPWITDAGQLQGKCLGVSLYISKPQKYVDITSPDMQCHVCMHVWCVLNMHGIEHELYVFSTV